ncbi:MAG: hypothetical protein KF889_20750 [Alphaproteobacteria bacterium]|nr:hypothetical protein [Alphaproteobacteria bacterium]MCW5744378.1 hypothetical protein [Alphaproteobacteria bacterium]
MHDIADLESRGIPSMGVATTAFVEAAAAQSATLGYEPTLVWVPHPIQDRTDDEIRQIADNAFDEILRRLTST